MADDVTRQMMEAALRADAQRKAAESGTVDIEQASRWFAKYLPDLRCPVCKQSDLGVVPQFVHMSLGPAGFNKRVRTMPCVGVVCQVCGHALFFNAIIMGQLAKSEE